MLLLNIVDYLKKLILNRIGFMMSEINFELKIQST